jgi:hypothetical protein
MSMDIKYGEFSFRNYGLSIPSISIDNNLSTTDAGALIGGTLNITLNGQIIATGSEPLNDNSNYTRSQLSQQQLTKTSWGSLLNQIKIIESGFGIDYQKLDIRCSDNVVWGLYQLDPETTKINRIEFSNQTDENWSNVIDYTIQLQVETTGALDYIPENKTKPSYVSSIENNYSITPITDNSYYLSQPTSIDAGFSNSFSGTYYPYATGNMYPGYTITRRLGATGKATKPNSNNIKTTALQHAKAFVTGLLYYDRSIYDILHNLTIYNRSTTIDASDIDGRYSITDTFIAYSGLPEHQFAETFNIQNSIDNNFARTVTIQGTIQGLKTVKSSNNDLYWNIYDSNNLDDKYLFPTYNEESLEAYKNASGFLDRFMMQKIPYHRCLASIFPSGGFITDYRLNLNGSSGPLFKNLSGWLNPIPINVIIDHNISQSSIDYTFTFDSRPLNLIPGAFYENLDVKDEFATRQYSYQTVYLRMPLTQDLGTYSLPSRTVIYSASFIPQNDFNYLNSTIKQRIDNTLNEFNPNKLNPPFIQSNNAGKYYYYSWINNQSENFDPIKGAFNKTVTWNYELRYWS